MNSQEIVSCELTENSVDDATMTGPLLSQVEGKVERFYDGVYEKKKAREIVVSAGAKAIVPPPKNADRVRITHLRWWKETKLLIELSRLAEKNGNKK